MMIRLIALDLDDTLLHTDLSISEGNRNAIQAAIEAGVTVLLATGRMHSSALRYANELRLDVPLITYQGALVKTSLSEEVWYERNLSPDQAARIVEFGRAEGFHTQLYQNDLLFVEQENEHVIAYEKLGGIQYKVANLSEVAKQGTIKGLFSGTPSELDRITPKLKELLGDGVQIFKSKPYYLEITNREATKGQALAHTAKQLQISRDEIMACGDSWNDIDMIQYAGLGVVMENAPDEIKEIADVLTASHIEDGVAQAITKYVLNPRTRV
jgi:Cof subfamily protein (haloacid dehalogenase superfamily)